MGYQVKFCLKGMFIEMLSAEPSWCICFVVFHDVILSYKKGIVYVLKELKGTLLLDLRVIPPLEEQANSVFPLELPIEGKEFCPGCSNIIVRFSG